MKNHLLSLLVAFLLCTSCTQEQKPNIVVSGFATAGQEKLYLKYCNPFQFNQQCAIVDSATVDQNGFFSFSTSFKKEGNLTLSTHPGQSIINEVLAKEPEKFGYSFCSTAILSEPTFYIQHSQEIEINLKAAQCPIEYDLNSEFMDGQKFIKFYNQNRNGIIIDLEKRFKSDHISLQKGFDITKDYIIAQTDYLNLASEVLSPLDQYLYTELKLGSFNDFLIWSNTFHKEEMKSHLENGQFPKEYMEIFKFLHDGNWSIDSTEYYKLCENYVTNLLNQKNRKHEKYYKYSKDKEQIAKNHLPLQVRRIYVENLKSSSNAM